MDRAAIGQPLSGSNQPLELSMRQLEQALLTRRLMSHKNDSALSGLLRTRIDNQVERSTVFGAGRQRYPRDHACVGFGDEDRPSKLMIPFSRRAEQNGAIQCDQRPPEIRENHP